MLVYVSVRVCILRSQEKPKGIWEKYICSLSQPGVSQNQLSAKLQYYHFSEFFSQQNSSTLECLQKNREHDSNVLRFCFDVLFYDDVIIISYEHWKAFDVNKLNGGSLPRTQFCLVPLGRKTISLQCHAHKLITQIPFYRVVTCKAYFISLPTSRMLY